jgi:hypothetical protein
MKRIRKSSEGLAEQKEEIPRKQNAHCALNRTPRACHGSLFGGSRFRKRFQTRSADDTVVVFGNALAAKESRTFQTACHRLTSRMIQASQMSKIGHVP